VLSHVDAFSNIYIPIYVSDSLIVAVRPKAPPKHIRAGYDEEEEDDDLVRTMNK